MGYENTSRRGFLRGLAACLGGLGLAALAAPRPAEAGRSRRRVYGWGYPGYRVTDRRRYYRATNRRPFYPGAYPGYYPSGGYYGAPYVAPGPVYVPRPVPYPAYGYPYTPLMRRDGVRAIDALSLLEA